jgi:hypothetical protein
VAARRGSSSARGQGGRTGRAPRLIYQARLQFRAPLRNGTIEKFERQGEGGKIVLFERPLIEASERIFNDGIDFSLRC